LNDKVGLLNEVHHRVKNNLQVITSLLRLEANRSAHAETKAVLSDMQGRIRSMALLHESLYRTGTFASVELGAYLKQLCTQAFRASAQQNDGVQLVLDLGAVQVSLDQATPCGLLVNELVANCFKHGFPAGRTGEVRVALTPVDAVQWCLSVSDNGVGLPTDFEARRTTSLGLQLVSDLCHQLGGKLGVGPGPGAAFTLQFSIQIGL
jgi:two-component sensor histidine kinase